MSDSSSQRQLIATDAGSSDILDSTFVTLLFTDIEGSTRLWERHPVDMRVALARHDALLHRTIDECGGQVFKTFGDAFCAVFANCVSALWAAVSCQRALLESDWGDIDRIRVRMALHAGEVYDGHGDYFGPTVNRVARILSAGHGDQVLVSQTAKDLVSDRLPDGIDLLDLASHRLKDLEQPEHLFQAAHPSLPYEFPPLRSLQAHANNIPVQTGSFVGRAAEMKAVEEQIASNRLVNLIGPAGCGKSRLALQVAAERIELYGDGVWYLDLADSSEPSDIDYRLAAVLGICNDAGDYRHTGDALARRISRKHLLIVLDNCHARSEEAREIIELLLGRCAKLHILATARVPLEATGETVWSVPSLAVPDAGGFMTAGSEAWDKLLEYDSVKLFIERARNAGTRFVLNASSAEYVAAQCRTLGGIPTAIESAATQLLSVDAPAMRNKILERIRSTASQVPSTDAASPQASMPIAQPNTAPPRHTDVERELAELRDKLTHARKRAKSTLENYAEAAGDELTTLTTKVKSLVKRKGKSSPTRAGNVGDE